MQDTSRGEKSPVVCANTVPMSAALKLKKDGRRKDLIWVTVLTRADGSWEAYFFVYDVTTGDIEKYDRDSLQVC